MPHEVGQNWLAKPHISVVFFFYLFYFLRAHVVINLIRIAKIGSELQYSQQVVDLQIHELHKHLMIIQHFVNNSVFVISSELQSFVSFVCH